MLKGKGSIQLFVEQLRNGHAIWMMIKGKCMHPFINRGDYLIVKPISFEEIRVGDIIAYKRSSHKALTTHRVLKKTRDIKGECLMTKGDASIHGDPSVYPEEV